jgi:hypothetical protein
MESYLNPYHNFINVLTKDGQTLLSNAINKLKSPLDGENKISLQPGGKVYQTLKDNLTLLSHRFRYHNLLHNVVPVCAVTPEIPAIIADATANILAATAIPALISYTNEIKNHGDLLQQTS